MEVEVSAWGVLGAAVASMVVGSIWYAKPVFGNTWIKLVGLKDKDMKEGATRSIILAALMSLLTTYVLAHITYMSYIFFDYSFLGAALSTAVWLWLGISLTRTVMQDAFEMRPPKLTVLNAANQLAIFLAMGLVIGLVGL